MTDTDFPLTADSDYDDLPRTLRRERDARAREKREREQRSMEPSLADVPAYLARQNSSPAYGDEPIPASVRRFDVPFFRLVAFFMKAVLAAIPALMLLTVILYFAGKGLQAYYPELIRMKIMITFPG